MRISFFLSVVFLLCNQMNAQEFEWLYRFEDHQSAVSFVSFRLEDNLILSGDEQGHILIWDAIDGQLRGELKGHTDLITHIAFSESGELVASASYDGSIKIWQLEERQLLQSIANTRANGYDDLDGDEPTFVLFHPEDKGVYYGGYNLEVLYTDLKTRKTDLVFRNKLFAITCGQFSPDRKNLLIGLGPQVRSVKLEGYKENFQLNNTDLYDQYICEMAFRPGTNTLATWTYEGQLQFWDVQHEQLRYQLLASTQEGTSNIAFSENGEFLVTGNSGTQTKLWDLRKKEVIQTFEKHDGKVVCFSFSSDGNYIATGSKDKSINVWKRKFPKTEQSLLERITKTDRLIETQHEIKVRSQNIELTFRDNQKIDGDSISVSLNGDLILRHHCLTQQSKRIRVSLKKKNNYLIIYAHNEGSISPNTLAVEVIDENNQRQVSLSSNMKKSGAIRIVYDEALMVNED